MDYSKRKRKKSWKGDPNRKRIRADYYKESYWANHNRDVMQIDKTISKRMASFSSSPGNVYTNETMQVLGNPTLLEEYPLVCVTSRSWFEYRTKDEIDKTKEVGREIALRGCPVLHMNSKGAEKNMGQYLRWENLRQIIFPFYGIIHFKRLYGRNMALSVERGLTTIISPFSSFEAWDLNKQGQRNIMMAHLADIYFGIVPAVNSMSNIVLHKALEAGKQVYVHELFIDDSNNVGYKRPSREDYAGTLKELYDKGAIPFRVENIGAIIRNARAGKIWTP